MGFNKNNQARIKEKLRLITYICLPVEEYKYIFI